MSSITVIIGKYNNTVQNLLTKYNIVITDATTYETIYQLPTMLGVISAADAITHVNDNALDNRPKVFESLGQALAHYNAPLTLYGCPELYNVALNQYTANCSAVIIHHDGSNIILPSLSELSINRAWRGIGDETVETITINHITDRTQEYQYLHLLREILTYGKSSTDRTGTGTVSLFGKTMTFDLRHEFPLLTTKQVAFETIKKELLFFINGHTNSKLLEKQGVNIWKGNTTISFLQQRGLTWQEGDMGPTYGFQWRHAGATYQGCDVDYQQQGIDQLSNLIKSIKEQPHDRRHIISAWNVADLANMALPPCHCFAQFYVQDNYLDCTLYQRSADMFLGVPFNIASYSLLMVIVGQLTGLIPRYFIHNLGDCHIYLNHVEQVREQLQRRPYALPQLQITKQFTNIDDITLDSFRLLHYQYHPKIVGKMAV